MRPLKEKISITIDNDILAKLKDQAEKDDRSLSQYINLILKQHIAKTEAGSDSRTHVKLHMEERD